jgi:hypothetical protein
MTMSPHEDAPFEQFQQSRRASCEDAEKRIARHGRRFLLFQLTALASLLVFTQFKLPLNPWIVPVAVIALVNAAWFWSLREAGYAAVVTISRYDVLETAWIAIGLAPWALLMAEITATVLLLISR